MNARADVIVLGAGMVGVSVALHLQRRGRDVALIDRRDPGEETSYGNAGLIQREAVIPYTFPREFGVVLSYAMNKRRDAVYHLSALPRIAPWLFQYWRNATPERVERSMRALAPLMAQCVKEHDALIAEVGSAADRTGGKSLRIFSSFSIMMRLLEPISGQMELAIRETRRLQVYSNKSVLIQLYKEHQEIVEAIQAGNPDEAQNKMRQLLFHVERMLMPFLK